ncbi:MAG: hypothetical protein II823_04950, partial [Kiritimatiellae bacterium]|nr:hypothetical protein [Kiritimatiellia bacterium]
MTTGTNRSKGQNINPAFRPDPFRCGEEGEPSGGGETERSGSGTSKSNNSIRERVRERAIAFAASRKTNDASLAPCFEAQHSASWG